MKTVDPQCLSLLSRGKSWPISKAKPLKGKGLGGLEVQTTPSIKNNTFQAPSPPKVFPQVERYPDI